MYKVIDTKENIISYYDDLRDFVEEYMTIDDVIESLDDIYEPVDLPIVGKMHISTIVKNLASDDDLDMLLNDEIDYETDNLIYEIEHYGTCDWGDYEISEPEEEDAYEEV
jgi:hypothetical protein